MHRALDPYEIVRNTMAEAAQLSAEEWEEFKSRLSMKRLLKFEHIIREGEYEKNLTFLAEGICRDYVLKDGKEFTLNISFPGEFIGGYASLVSGQPSKLYVQALSPVTLFQLSAESLSALYDLSKNGERIGRISAEQLYVVKESREIDLLTLTAYERFEKLMNEQPNLVLTIPQKYLSEYLGMTPENFSRMKRKYMEGA